MCNIFKSIFMRMSALTIALLVTLGIVKTNPTLLETGEKTTALTQTNVVLTEPGFGLELYQYFSKAEKGFIIPGLFEGFIPQGIFYDNAHEVFLISGYYKDKKLPSQIAVIDKDGKLIKSVGITDKNGAKSVGHFGGIAAFEDYVYIASTKIVSVISFEALMNAENGSYVPTLAELSMNATCSSINMCDGTLYICEFQLKKSDEPRCYVYTLDKNGIYGIKEDKINSKNSVTADYSFSIPIKIQGMLKLPDGRIVLSSSYGPFNSKVYVYKNIEDKAKSEEYYQTKNKDLLKTYSLPPYAEEITIGPNGKIYVLTESAADPYKNKIGNIPIDFVMKWNIQKSTYKIADVCML